MNLDRFSKVNQSTLRKQKSAKLIEEDHIDDYFKKRSTMKRIRPLLCCFLFWTALFATAPAIASNEITRGSDGKIIIDAQDLDLFEILKELYDKYSVEVSGLEIRKSEKFTFSIEADTLETLLRRLLRYLGVKNFAIQFADARLTRIVVLPESVSEYYNIPRSADGSIESAGIDKRCSNHEHR